MQKNKESMETLVCILFGVGLIIVITLLQMKIKEVGELQQKVKEQNLEISELKQWQMIMMRDRD
jgi:uncharacterized membrane protein YciS (DUF1049 family)